MPERDARTDVLFVNMPLSTVERPCLPLGIFTSILRQNAIATRTLYANVELLRYVDGATYSLLDRMPSSYAYCDWLFAPLAFPESTADPDAYVDMLLEKVPLLLGAVAEAFGDDRDPRVFLKELRGTMSGFLDDMVERALSFGPKVVGCTSTFQQHVPSLALLRRIKEARPGIVTMLGGANCESEMGSATHRLFDYVDYVVSGEADDLILPLVRRALHDGIDVPARELPFGVFGPAHRVNGTGDAVYFSDVPRATVHSLDTIPPPDYADYFETVRSIPGLYDSIVFALPIEGSRGCYWGRCLFCGLNGLGSGQRAKSPEKFFSEMNGLADEYGVTRMEVADNVLHPDHVGTLFPRLVSRGSRYRIFYEVRTSLKKSEVRDMARAGTVWVQAGVESLSAQILKVMNKGASVWRHVQFLKWARQFGMRVIWKIMIDFPAEEDHWYAEMAELMPLLYHLEPPDGVNSLRYDRFSVYHRSPKQFGIELVPHRTYRHIYPVSDEELMNIAYFFEDENELRRLQSPILSLGFGGSLRPGLEQSREAIKEWVRYTLYDDRDLPVLQIVRREPTVRIVDTRAVATAPVHDLDATESAVYLACDSAQETKSLRAEMTAAGISDEAFDAAVSRLIGAKLLLKTEGRLLALALEPSPRALPAIADAPTGFLNDYRIASGAAVAGGAPR
jgi:ribosomal peptide maturation radical SAM protein 1